MSLLAADYVWFSEHGIPTKHANAFGIDRSVSGLRFPWRNAAGEVIYQVRPDAGHPDNQPEGQPKYRFEKGARPPVNCIRPLDDGPIIVVEGTKQSLAFSVWAPEEYSILGIAGCRNWQAEDFTFAPRRDFYIAFDADRKSNSGVAQAGHKLRETLIKLGASSVSFVHCPGFATEGWDDILGRTIEAKRQAVIELALATAEATGGDDGNGNFIDGETFLFSLEAEKPPIWSF